MHNCLLHKLGN